MSGDTFVYGTLGEQPWGQALSGLAARGLTGQVTITADDKVYAIAFDQGVIVGAASPLVSDAIVRIAVQNQMMSPSYAAEIARRIAAAPDRDEVDVLAEAAQLTPELVQRLRRRAILQRAARTFALEHGEFTVTERIAMPTTPGSGVDVRAVVYLGARMHLHEQRLAADLRALGSHFVLRVDALQTVPDYELTPAEDPIIEALKIGTNLPELEATHREIDPRTAQAVVYALACCGACEIEHRPAIPRTATAVPRGVDREMVRMGLAQPVRGRSATTSGVPEAPRPPRLAPSKGGYSLRPTNDPGVATGRARTTEPPLTRPVTDGLDPPTARGVLPRAPSADAIDPPTARGTGGGPTARDAAAAGRAAAPRPAAGTTSPSTARAPTPSFGGDAPTPPRTRTTDAPPAAARTKTGEPITGRAPTARGPAVARTSTARRTMALVAARSILVEQGADYFAVLGVPHEASPDIVRVAFLNLVKQLHPDRLGDLETPEDRASAQRLFAHMNNAFAVLTDPVRRSAYLDGLKRGVPTPGFARVKTGDLPEAPPALQAVRRAELALKSDRPGEAVKELQRACELEPNNVDHAAMLAWARFCASSDKLAAVPECRKPLERAILRSDKPEIARFYLGRIERIVGRDREALRHFHEVLDRVPNHPEAAAEVRAIEARLAAASRR